MRLLKSASLLLFFVILFLGGGILIWYRNSLRPVTEKEVFHRVIIPKGASAQKVANILAKEDLVRSPLAFRIYVKLNSFEKLMPASTVISLFSLSNSMILSNFVKSMLRLFFLKLAAV